MAWMARLGALGVLFQLLAIQDSAAQVKAPHDAAAYTSCGGSAPLFSNVNYGTEYNKWYWQPFNRKAYMLPNVKKPWGDAVTWCAMQGATLASIHNARENDVVQCLHGSKFQIFKDKWVGGMLNFTSRRATVSVSLSWQDNTTFDYGFTSTSGGPAPPWADNGPYIPTTHSNRKCILFDGREVGWRNGNCEKPRHFICQKK